MKKAILIIFSLCLLSACTKEVIYEKPSIGFENPYEITLDEARATLLDIMGTMETTKSGESLHRNIKNGYTVTRNIVSDTKSIEEHPFIHIFNFEDETGFAIMSADKRVTPLLAYALQGELEQEQEIDNPGLKIYLDKLEDYVYSMITIVQDSTTRKDSTNWIHTGFPEYTTMINGYCPVEWNQNYPYNYYCPEIDGKRTLTGCVATAVAQLMCCYRYPDRYNGYDFDWEDMIESSNTEYQPEPCDSIGTAPIDVFPSFYPPWIEPDSAMLQVAKLMQLLGLEENLNVNYGTSSSGASMTFIPRTLENFGYSDGGNMIYSSEVISPNPEQTVINELSNGYYCIISGSRYIYKESDDEQSKTENTDEHNNNDGIFHPIGDDNSNTKFEGHCWLLHGLLKLTATNLKPESDVKYYFLCNFGWGGSSDGFYLANVFNIGEGPVFNTPTKGDTSHEKDELVPDPYNFSYIIEYVTGIRK